MSSTVFVNNVTLTDSDWFNDVNTLHYTIFGDPTTAHDIRKKLWVKGADVASAVTITAPTDGNYVHVTGTTTITGFSAVSSGYVLRVTFDGILNLTHNVTSFILPGGTSILTAAGDTATFVNESGSNWRCLEYVSVASAGVPSGAVSAYAGTAAPSGWVLCFGQAVSRTTYAGLFSILSTQYGVGDGATTFNLPDLRGRSVFGKDDMGGSAASRVTATSGITGTTLGAAGGDERAQSHTHAAGTLAASAHTHTISSATSGIATFGAAPATNDYSASAGSNMASRVTVTATDSTTPSITGSTASTSSGSSQNMPPALVLNYIIKT